jgi:lipoprotein-releasing system permease protein
MRFELFVALRYLKAKRKQAVISVITVISVLGVMAGVAALVVALAINTGFREELEKRLLGAMANINLLHPEDSAIRDYDALAARLARLPHVIADAPAVYEEVLISGKKRGLGVLFKGIDPRREVLVADLLTRLKEGSLKGLSEPGAHSDPLVIGKELARQLGVFVGDTVRVTSPQGSLTPFGVVPKFRNFRIVGVFDSGFYDFDATWAFTSLEAAQRLFDLDGNVASVIEFKVDNIYRAPEIAEAIRKAAGPGFTATTWMEQNHSLLAALSLERLVEVLTIGLIMFVAALNILITLAMMVMEKNHDIAVLASMGARKRQVWAIFTLHGLSIGFIGTVLGLILGYVISWIGNAYHLIPLQADVYALASVPFHARAWDGVWIASAALAISFLATLYPSLSAARLNPVEILRYE